METGIEERSLGWKYKFEASVQRWNEIMKITDVEGEKKKFEK